jgi:hypothetical protein
MKNILTIAILTMTMSHVEAASQEQHLAKMSKDAKVMQKIIETTSQPALGKVKVESIYLLGQGFIFELKTNPMYGMSHAFAPPPPSFSGNINVEDWVDMYADWGESVAEMTQESIDFSIENNFDSNDRGKAILNEIKQKKELLKASLNLEKERLKALYKAKQRLDRQLEDKLESFVQEPNQKVQDQKQLEIDIIKEKQKELAKKIDQTRKERREQTESFKKNLLEEREKKQRTFEKTILTNFCEYSLSLRNLEDNEQVSFVFPNFSQDADKKIYVFTNKQIKKCQTNGDKAENILSNVTHYEF